MAASANLNIFNTLQTVLEYHATLKKRYVRATQPIMVSSKLRDKHLKSKSKIDKPRYSK